MNPSPPIPAATLVLFRDRPGGPPDLLMVERTSAMAFAAGALVFPGGRVDDGDRAMAAYAADPDDAAARIAAIRETLEETGIAVGFAPQPHARAIAGLRDALAAGEPFADAVARGGWTLDLDALYPWARWCPNFRETRSFDARFYIARLPDGAPEPSADATENERVLWTGADAALALARRGEARVIFPTQRNLERLALFTDFDAAAAHSADIPVRLIQPWVEQRDDVAHLCIPDDLGYPTTAVPLDEVQRG